MDGASPSTIEGEEQANINNRIPLVLHNINHGMRYTPIVGHGIALSG